MPPITTIFFGDTHFTNRPADEYRWGIIDFLEKLIVKTGARYLVHCGDLTDAKDEHAAILVNRVVRNFRRLARALTANSESHASIFFIAGNHDRLVNNEPFFKFLHRGLMGRIFFFDKPTEIGLWQQKFLFLPHTTNFQQYLDKYDFAKFDRVVFHQPIAGAMTENGTKLADGMSPYDFNSCGGVAIGGDVHYAQTIGKVTYTGAPYPVRYGDVYDPRVLVETDGVFESVPVPGPRKAVIDFSSHTERTLSDFKTGDMVKCRVSLERAAFGDFLAIRRAIEKDAKKRGILLGSVKLVEKRTRPVMKKTGHPKIEPTVATPAAVLKSYAQSREIGQQLFEFAERLVK